MGRTSVSTEKNCLAGLVKGLKYQGSKLCLDKLVSPHYIWYGVLPGQACCRVDDLVVTPPPERPH